MRHRLDPMPVGIGDEGGVVGRVIFGAEPGLAVVAAAGGERRAMEGVDRGTARREEAGMTVRRLRRFQELLE